MAKKENKEMNAYDPLKEEILNIPEDEIYTYRIEGLAAPHINKPYSHYTLKKAIFIIVIVIAVSLSMYFSLSILRTDTFTFAEISDGNYQFTKFSNPGYIEELHIDYVIDIVYEADENAEEAEKEYIYSGVKGEYVEEIKTKDDLMKYQAWEREEADKKAAEKVIPDFKLVEDKSKPVTSIREYAINGDGYIKKIYIGPKVTDIDGKAFYSCWALNEIIVDENNPNYCDIDGVLYTKDKKTVVCYPCDRDQYLREKNGYPTELWQDVPKSSSGEPLMSDEAYQAVYEEYVKEVMTYTIPSSVTTVGELCFNYSNLKYVYLPEGLKRIENLGFFEMPNMTQFYTYVTENAVTDTTYAAQEGLKNYMSFPDGLEYIGTDAFSYSNQLQYLYIPSSVTYIGHHAFWDDAYLDDGEIRGLPEINVELDKDTFKENVETGDQWVPIYDSNLLRKIPVNYGAERQS